jgi:SAM-dependent methyltransferase
MADPTCPSVPSDSGPELPPGATFRCNICGAACSVPLTDVRREEISCACGSTVRFRAVVSTVSCGLFGRSITLAEFPVNHDIVGLGMSDWDGYARLLSDHLGYTNTFYHQQPMLDVTAELPGELVGAHDFVTSSDVLEHIAPPFVAGLRNCRKLLKPGGFLVLTVPFVLDGHTVEHYPDLHDYTITTVGDTPVLVNRTAGGTLEVFGDLVFHGGDGSTLEMRLCALPDLLRDLDEAGFTEVTVMDENVPEHGIAWNAPWSLPILARAPQ